MRRRAVHDCILALDRRRASLRQMATYITAEHQPRLFRAVLRELLAIDALLDADSGTVSSLPSPGRSPWPMTAL
jgi:hypothetical protein